MNTHIEIDEESMIGRYGERMDILLRTDSSLEEEDIFFLREYFELPIERIINEHLYRNDKTMIEDCINGDILINKLFYIKTIYKYVLEEECYDIYYVGNDPIRDGNEYIHDNFDTFDMLMMTHVLDKILELEKNYGYENIMNIKTEIVNDYIHKRFYKRAYDTLVENEKIFSDNVRVRKNINHNENVIYY